MVRVGIVLYPHSCFALGRAFSQTNLPIALEKMHRKHSKGPPKEVIFLLRSHERNEQTKSTESKERWKEMKICRKNN